MIRHPLRKMAILSAVIICIDQVVKIIVKTNMFIGQDIPVLGDWFHIHFIENQGMAFGLSFGGAIGKSILTIIRLVASIAIAWLIVSLSRRKTRTSLLISLTLIFTGAVGNLIDSLFYGLIFNESYYQVATLFPSSGGYASFLQGRVVDMLYFPLISTTLPSWIPFFGGQHFEFFNAIFNIADSAITIGVIWLIIDQIFLSKKNSEEINQKKIIRYNTLIFNEQQKKH